MRKETPDPADPALSNEIKRFVAAMPKIDTERHEIKARLIEQFSIPHENAQTTLGVGQAAAQIETKHEPNEPQSKLKYQEIEI